MGKIFKEIGLLGAKNKFIKVKAIKWIKRNQKKMLEPCPDFVRDYYIGANGFIKSFFNLTKNDLK